VGDIGIAVFKTNSRNAALLEEFLRVRGEEFLKAQADRIEDPGVVRPGAGQEGAEKIPGKASSGSRLFSRRSSKKTPAVEDTPTKAKGGKKASKSSDKSDTKGN